MSTKITKPIYIIVGLGVVGSSAAYSLTKRGFRVLAFDANARGHTLGSSHGRTRITRQAYFEAADYVPLIQHSQRLWEELERRSNRKLFSKIGAIFLGEPGCELVEGSRKSAVQHGLKHEMLDAEDLQKRFPAFKVPQEAVALLEKEAGILHADECLMALQSEAEQLGAQLNFETEVRNWTVDATGIVHVELSNGDKHDADGLVIAAGPWSPTFLQQLNLPLQARRVLCAHFEPESHDRFSPDNLPVWCLQFDQAFLYGFPHLQGQGLKLGRHDDGEQCTPESARRNVSDAELEKLKVMAERYMPGVAQRLISPVTCMYTDTPDGQFIVERHRTFPNVAYMAGCSGHAFKFGPVLGEVLADLATSGVTAHEIEFLASSRFAVVRNS